jgi:hypothetical protein
MKLLVTLLILSLSLTLIVSFKTKRVGKTNIKIKAGPLRKSMIPLTDAVPNLHIPGAELSVLEERPEKYRRLTDAENPKPYPKIYAKDPEAYYGNEKNRVESHNL